MLISLLNLNRFCLMQVHIQWFGERTVETQQKKHIKRSNEQNSKKLRELHVVSVFMGACVL